VPGRGKGEGLETLPEMTLREDTLQPSCDRILWILANSGGKMERSKLRRCMGMTYTELDAILIKLAKEGKIRRAGETIRI
jgi:predicted Rossmann fold nucleotide-binding protein DprA/Smf involved in DNA uptake